MKKSARSAGAIRMRPSAPTPRWRSHSARIAAGPMRRASWRSSTITKSLPVPWYLANRTASDLHRPLGPGFPDTRRGQELPELVHDLRGASLPGGEPPDPRVPPEPPHLPPRQRPVAAGDPGHRLLLAELAPKARRSLSVADDVGRNDERPESPIQQGPRLRQQPGEVPTDPLLDPAVQGRPGHLDAGRHHRSRVEHVPRVREGGEG